MTAPDRSADGLRARPRPCPSCPYRRDVPSGVWDASEYPKLPPYDGETFEQPPAAFHCHQGDGHLCSGWLAVHDPYQLLAVRLGVLSGRIDVSVLDYATDVPLFGSGLEAAEHGLAGVEHPDEAAQRAMAKILAARRIRRSRPDPRA